MKQFSPPRVSQTPTTGQVLPKKICSSTLSPFSAVYTCLQYLQITLFRPFFCDIANICLDIKMIYNREYQYCQKHIDEDILGLLSFVEKIENTNHT